MPLDRAETVAECRRLRWRIARRDADQETIRVLTEALNESTALVHVACEQWRKELKRRLACEAGWHRIMGHSGYE